MTKQPTSEQLIAKLGEPTRRLIESAIDRQEFTEELLERAKT